jgi:dicarboxylate/amino acid:cation (Na+ or H+) symporter, DAACS family
MKLWMKILIGLVLGLIIGPLLGEKAEYLRPVGMIFLNLINMLVVLLVFSSMTVGITSIHDPKKLGRVGLKTLVLYFCTTVVAIFFGLFFAKLIKPGLGVNLGGADQLVLGDMPKISQVLMDIIPINPISSLANGNILQIIVFALFLGVAINFCGDRARPVLRFLESLSEIMYQMTSIVMEFAPYGVLAIMGWVAGTYGLDILLPLGKFLLCNYVACIVHSVVVFGFILLVLARLNPMHFFRGMGDAMAFAFSTNSSSATLPVSLHCLQKNLGVSKNIASFVLPLGATVNMNGAAIFQAITALFVAQAYGIHLGWQSLITIVVTATLSAVGSAGIPGTSLIMLSVVLSSVGLPLEGLAIVAGVDRVREMVSTVVNILGDAVVGIYVAKTENELDVDQYNHRIIVGVEESDI